MSDKLQKLKQKLVNNYNIKIPISQWNNVLDFMDLSYNLGKEQAEKKEGWVTLKSGLPPKYINVLVSTDFNRIYQTCVDDSGEFDRYPLEFEEEITHWQPLPKPPVLKPSKQ